jgi:hypothetical protein
MGGFVLLASSIEVKDAFKDSTMHKTHNKEFTTQNINIAETEKPRKN